MAKPSRRHADAFYAVDAGVVADGVTDDQPAIAEAQTRARLLANGRAGKVILPAGDIYLGSTLQIDDDQDVIGAGLDNTRLVFDGDLGVEVGGNNVVTTRAGLSDLTISGMGNSGEVGIRLGDLNSSPQTGAAVIRRFAVEECNTAGMDLGQVAYLRLDDCDFRNNAGDGLIVDPALPTSGQSTTVRALGCRFQGNDRGAVILSLNTSTFIGCSFETNDREGLVVEVPGTGSTGTGIRAIWLTDAYFEGNLQDGNPGAQMRWNSTGSPLIQQLNLTRPFFSLPGAAAGQFNMDIGTGFASVEYPEQLSGSSIVRNDASVHVYVKDRFDPTNAKWDWDTSTGLAKINHEVWNGGGQRWQRWVNSPTGETLIESIDLNDARMAWWGAAEVARQTGVPVTAAGIHAALTAYGLIT